MELSRILIQELKEYQIIELREAGPEGEETPAAENDENGSQRRSFPIVIGLPEAQAIERRIKGISIKRPQTHDLLASVVTSLGAKLKSITITDLSEHTFFATLDVVKADGELIHIDSRPSDAIALGIANDVPIFVEEHVLDAALNEEG
jgi:bifunctional DNase/RNase